MKSIPCNGKNYSTVPLHDRENGKFYFISRDRKYPIKSQKFNKVLYNIQIMNVYECNGKNIFMR